MSPKIGVTKKFKILLILAFFALFMGTVLFTQNTPKNEILILIDRAPNTLSPSQTPDVMARKILPLIQEFQYSPGATGGVEVDLEDFILTPLEAHRPKLHFKVVKDDLTRAVWFSRNQADVLFDTLSLSKTRYFENQGAKLYSPVGFHLSFIGFNLKHPQLRRPEVRRALAQALPIELWIKQKYFGFVDPVSPLPEFDPEASKKLLDQAELKTKEDGFRFTLRYLTTPVREGNELALLVREALKQIGVRVEVVPLESSLFFNKLGSGEFELFGSRILRKSAEDSVIENFKTGGIRNYFGYSNLKLDEFVLSHPKASWTQIDPFLSPDSPIIPLFTWRHGLLLSHRIHPSGIDASTLDDSFRFLSALQLN
jgi:hypothetical protein